jgi:tetraacyldisaccharide 4'-kinase
MKKLVLPQFWYSEDRTSKSQVLSYALLPASWVYRFFCLLDQSITVKGKSPIPVICVGNVTMGGAGKTPTSQALLELVKEHGSFETTCFLMRGYGGNYSGALEVDPTQHTQWDVGDEALMQAQYAPVIVSRNRKKGAELATSNGYDLIIMDDGFQNFGLKKDFSLLVVDGQFGFGNNKCFPAGPLREPVQLALSRAQAALVIGRTDGHDLSALKDTRQYEATLKLNTKPLSDEAIENKKIVAFAGIARPEKFFDTLEHNGFEIHAQYGFADHHIYTHGQLSAMYQRAQKANAVLITTEKDWIRLSKSWKDKIDYVKISIEFESMFKSYFFKVLDRLK